MEFKCLISVQYVIRIQNRVTFKFKTGFYLGLLTTKTTKLLGITEIRISKDKNGEKVQHLEITEVTLVHYNIISNQY